MDIEYESRDIVDNLTTDYSSGHWTVWSTVVLDAMTNYLTISRRQQLALINFNNTIVSSESPLSLSACHA